MAEMQNPADPGADVSGVLPREVVVPLAGSQITPTPATSVVPTQAAPAPPAPAEPSAPSAPVPQLPAVPVATPEVPVAAEVPQESVDNVPAADNEASFQAGDPGDSAAPAVTWMAAEFIAHDKSVTWYIGLSVVVVMGAILILLATHDVVSVAVVIVAGILLGVYATHRPRELEYSLDSHGFNIGRKRYQYEQFKSFSVVPEGTFSTIVLLPLKRFGLQVTMHCPSEAEEAAVGAISNQLPLAEASNDHVDSLMRKIRF